MEVVHSERERDPRIQKKKKKGKKERKAREIISFFMCLLPNDVFQFGDHKDMYMTSVHSL